MAGTGDNFAASETNNFMKLAEALSLRAQLNNKITQLRSRLNNCVKIQEGDNPSKNPESAA